VDLVEYEGDGTRDRRVRALVGRASSHLDRMSKARDPKVQRLACFVCHLNWWGPVHRALEGGWWGWFLRDAAGGGGRRWGGRFTQSRAAEIMGQVYCFPKYELL